MALPRRARRSRFPLVVLLLATLTLITLDARDFGPLQRVENGLVTALGPFRSVGATVFGPVGDAWGAVTERDDLREEIELLREQNEQLLADRIDNADAAEELAALRAQLELTGNVDHPLVVAEVTAGAVSNFDPYVLEIDKGTADGISVGMPVLAEGGLVGRIEEARRGSARVRLITDPSIRIGVLIVGSDEIGIISGRGLDEPLRVADAVPVSAEVEVGDVLVTSGLDRSPYPEGLAVGMVSGIEIDELSLEKELIVDPVGRFERISFVTVVIYDPDAVEIDGDPGTVDPGAGGDTGTDGAEDGS